jgi:creatinine amidohydrolase
MPTPSSLHLERLTSPAAGAAIRAGATTAIFACGAVEQHGPHLPMFTDAEHGTRLAEGVAQRLGNALVAPTIRVGCSEHHMGFPGSLTVSPETLEALCRDYCVSLARHGFERICIIPSHGGNFAPLREMQPRLAAAVAPKAQVLIYTALLEMIESWRGAVDEVAGLGSRVGGHADIAETSIMLALHPDLVRTELAEAGFQAEITEPVLARIIKDGFKSVTPNGIIGDARGASAAIGERCIAVMVDRIAGYFQTASNS